MSKLQGKAGRFAYCVSPGTGFDLEGGRTDPDSGWDRAGRPKLAANEEQPSLSWAWQRCGGRREQNTGGTPMLQSARCRASLLRPVGAPYLFEMSKHQLGKAGRFAYFWRRRLFPAQNLLL